MKHLVLLLTFGCAAQETTVVETPLAAVEAPPVLVESPSPGRAELDAGMQALGNGELDRGIDLCEEALLLAASNDELRAETHTWLVHAYTLVDDPDSALAHVVLAIELHPEDPWLRYSQGIAYQKLGLFDDALDSLEQAITLDPLHIKACQWRAHILQAQERYSESIEDWNRALEILDQTDEAVVASWGGDKAAMIETCTRAISECQGVLGE